MAKLTNYHMCPSCSASWGIEEISFQECDQCGWPTSHEEDDDDSHHDQEFDPDELDDDDGDSLDTNDSRNL